MYLHLHFTYGIIVEIFKKKAHMDAVKVLLWTLDSLAEIPQLPPSPPVFGLIYEGAIGQPR